MKLPYVIYSLLFVLLVGCSTLGQYVVPTDSDVLGNRDEAVAALHAKNVCCKSFQDITYQDISVSNATLVKIDDSAFVFEFPEGKSYFSAYKLPANSGDLKITVEAEIGATVFFPKVLLMDSKFRKTRVISDNIFVYKSAKFLDPDRVEATFTIDRAQIGNPNNELYMVVFSAENELNKHIQITHPANLQAEALKVEKPGVKDPIIPYSPWGLVKITIEDLSGAAGKDNLYKPVYQDAIDANAPKVDKTPNKLVIAPASPVAQSGTTTAVAASTTVAAAAVVAPQAAPATTSVSPSSATMLPETESLYNQLIQKAVASGDIEKAMTLTNEAERAGSRSAKQTFVNAVKTGQK